MTDTRGIDLPPGAGAEGRAAEEAAMLREAPSRLARHLLGLAETSGRPAPGGLMLDIELSQTRIGSRIGASRESVIRQLLEWHRAGYVAVEAGSIVLRDRAALQEIARSGTVRRSAERAAPGSPSGLPAAEQTIAEAWDAADLDNRLDALLARLADTETRLDRQLARLDAGGG